MRGANYGASCAPLSRLAARAVAGRSRLAQMLLTISPALGLKVASRTRRSRVTAWTLDPPQQQLAMVKRVRGGICSFIRLVPRPTSPGASHATSRYLAWAHILTSRSLLREVLTRRRCYVTWILPSATVPARLAILAQIHQVWVPTDKQARSTARGCKMLGLLQAQVSSARA